MDEASDRADQLARSGLFDSAWYLQRYEDVARAGKQALDHFLEFGWAEGRWPNRYFDPGWYRLTYQDVAASGADPLLHYLEYGAQEDRRPHPLFDPVWYRAAYAVADDTLALAHDRAHRAAGSAVPCAELFAVPLMAPYREDAARGIDPVAHYLDDCARDGREAFPEPGLVAAARLIDENYYLINGSDVHEANADPVEHFCRFGWRENRKPNIYFDLAWYAQTNPDIARPQVNPLVHYILAGEAANRRPVPFFDPGWYRARYDVPPDQLALSHYLANRRKQIYSPTPLFDVQWYLDRFGHEIGPNRDPFTHFLHAGMVGDIDPSPGFDAARYRRMHLGRPSRAFRRLLRVDQHNPLVHHLLMEYAAQNPGA